MTKSSRFRLKILLNRATQYNYKDQSCNRKKKAKKKRKQRRKEAKKKRGKHSSNGKFNKEIGAKVDTKERVIGAGDADFDVCVLVVNYSI